MRRFEDDYRYGREAQERELRIHWKCNNCGKERQDCPGYNEGGQCSCGGSFEEAGESYSV